MANARVRTLRAELQVTERKLEVTLAQLRKNRDGWQSSTSAWGEVDRHPAVQAELEDAKEAAGPEGYGISLLEATLRALDKVCVREVS